MFEGKPISAPGFPHGDGTALRAIGWGELSARIEAARDLRRVLRSDSNLMAASFADAAAGYFTDLGDRERVVNPDVLEHRKPADGMGSSAQGDEQTSGREK